MSEIAPRPRAPSARPAAGTAAQANQSAAATATDTAAARKQRPAAAPQSPLPPLAAASQARKPRPAAPQSPPPPSLPPERAAQLARALAPWFLAHQRDLEWRHTRDPYAIWVSEVMLQQTRVDTVKSYWAPFMRRFPDIASLAAADEQQVLAAWSGLGYYRRARLLHAGARHVHTTLAGRMPLAPDELREIPGIGRYTAGAIASIAHDRPAALVDGNVARVLSRLQAITEPKQQAADAPGHWSLAQQIVEAGSPRVLAQALMELGATVCTPQQPRCEACPVRPHCLAYAQATVDQIPAPKKRAPSPQQDLWAVGLRKAGRLLLTRRPGEGLLAGMWCLPLIERPPAPPEAPHGGLFDRSKLTPAALRKALGARVQKIEPPHEPIKHVFTHRIWMLWPLRADLDLADGNLIAGPLTALTPDETAWILPGERPVGGIPTVTQRLLERLGY